MSGNNEYGMEFWIDSEGRSYFMMTSVHDCSWLDEKTDEKFGYTNEGNE